MTNGNGANADLQVKKHSVTADDVGNKSTPVWQFVLGGGALGGKSDIPPYWSPARDKFLRASIYRESLWASSVHIALTKSAAQGWELKGDQKRVVSRWQELLLAADGNQSWTSFLQKQLMDYLTTGNGQFFEIVRASNARGSRIIGLMHLDSLRMTRTGDPQIPFLYRDRKNRLHEMRYYQCLALADAPDPSEMWYGTGHCAAERAFPAIRKLAALETYIYEKVSGKRALAVHIIGGMSEASYRAAVTASQEEASQKGAVIYMGSTVVPVMGDVAPTLVTIPLASIPDGFDRKEEFDICVLQYANALGIDVQDLQPISNSKLGTGAQSKVLDDKARGKGLITWRQHFMHQINEKVVPDRVSFAFRERDQTELQRQVAITQARAATVQGLLQSNLLILPQAQQLLVEWDVVPKDLLPQYPSNNENLSDDEKPEPEPDPAEVAMAIAATENAAALAQGQMGQPGQAGGAPSGGFPPPAGYQGGGDSSGGGGFPPPSMSFRERHDEEEQVDAVQALRDVALALIDQRARALLEQVPAYKANGSATRTPDVHVLLQGQEIPAPVVNVAPAQVTLHLPQQQAPVVNNYLPQMAAPSVDVHVSQPPITPTINLPETRISVQSAVPDIKINVPPQAAPVVNVAPAAVNVNVPEQAAPVVNVTVPSPEQGEQELVVKRGRNGLIDSIVKRVRS